MIRLKKKKKLQLLYLFTTLASLKSFSIIIVILEKSEDDFVEYRFSSFRFPFENKRNNRLSRTEWKFKLDGVFIVKRKREYKTTTTIPQ